MTTFILASFVALLIFVILISLQLLKERQKNSFEITTQNKDTQKGFAWYEEEIISIMASFRHELIVDEKELKVWRPWGRWRATGGEFRMIRTPYSITIEGASGMVRIVVSQLDLQKIFL